VIEHISNPVFLKSLYPENLSFKDVIIDSLLFSYDGPSVEMSIQHYVLPTNPPLKWLKVCSSFNRVHFSLRLFDLHEFKFAKWGNHNICDVNFDAQKNKLLKIILSGEDCDAYFVIDWIYVKSITPFLVEE
jgi:hypothetical protein